MQYYEVKEATSLVELALWKFNIEQAVGLDRGVCRIDLPEPSKDLILQYVSTHSIAYHHMLSNIYQIMSQECITIIDVCRAYFYFEGL